VQPAYYAAIVASEAICGMNHTTAQADCSSRNVTIAELASGSSGFEHIAVYAFREKGVLARVLLINSLPFFREQADSVRPSTHVDLRLTASSEGANSTFPVGMAVKRLTIGYADDVAGLTWGGQTFETPDARAGHQLVVPKVAVNEGVDIQATEVVLLSFTY
jgi:hypothetical protein